MKPFLIVLTAALTLCSCGSARVRPIAVGKRLPPVSLDLADGSAFVRAQGIPVVISFVYSRCADICPLTLASLKRVYERLEQDDAAAQFLLVTVDPDRDVGAPFEAFLDSYEPSFAGLTGTPEAVHEVLHALGAHFEKAYTSSADGYSMKHSAEVIVADGRGIVRHIFPFGTAPEQITKAVEAFQ